MLTLHGVKWDRDRVPLKWLAFTALPCLDISDSVYRHQSEAGKQCMTTNAAEVSFARGSESLQLDDRHTCTWVVYKDNGYVQFDNDVINY